VALVFLYSAFVLYPPSNQPVVDPYHIAELQQRFQVLNGDVASDVKLGYVSDVPPDAMTIFGLQYAVAPRLLVKDDQPHRFVLGNFSTPLDYTEFGEARGLRVVKEYPRGVVLYEVAR